MSESVPPRIDGDASPVPVIESATFVASRPMSEAGISIPAQARTRHPYECAKCQFFGGSTVTRRCIEGIEEGEK